jgi:hypothetical protein
MAMKTNLPGLALTLCLWLCPLASVQAEDPGFTTAGSDLIDTTISGRSFAAIQTAMKAFQEKLPGGRIEDYVITVRQLHEAILVTFTNKNEPPLKEGEVKAGSLLPELNVSVSNDGKMVFSATFSI